MESSPTLYVYYETDGDAGWYGVRLFSQKRTAEQWRDRQDRVAQGYAHIEPIKVDDISGWFDTCLMPSAGRESR